MTGLLVTVSQSCTEVSDFDNSDLHKYPWLSNILIDYHNQPIRGKHVLDLGTIEFEYGIDSISREAFGQLIDSISVANNWKLVGNDGVAYTLQKEIEEVKNKRQIIYLKIMLIEENNKVRYRIE